jgi:single-strand DNA-binding protein
VSFAKVVISGTLTSEPEKRFTPNNHAVTNFNLSVENSSGFSRQAANNEPFTVKVTCWRNLAEASVEHLHKGEFVLVEGKLILNSFQGQDGVQKKFFEVEAVSIDKLPGPPVAIMPVVAAEGASGVTQGSAAKGGFEEAGSRTSNPSYGASAPAQQETSVSSGGGGGHFSSEDLLTEDDIPF